ncbi:DNA modification methylase [Candidatus Nitrospira neomarina]|uniref:site-specific DNA-methyltransferase (adenine-specific) n=1 Tax=Candidatus Nitrospira neomarina TaxID=3020899 RepID=A0AA96GLN3_9BACT|nr:DNA modification methylase [Candidatus Nitrospira neomarina]WNM63152.1 DNA modification methylase [Candidatus Nitrospira neomarina]
MGLTHVPTIRLADLTEAQKRAYLLADNKLVEQAGWDRELLALEFQELQALELDCDLTITGFSTAEIDLLMDSLSADDDDPDGDDPNPGDEPPPTTPPVSRRGDLWLLGPHRVLCGDATDPAAFLLLMEGQLAQMVFLDPPYNVPIGGHVCGLGAVQHPNFAMASGEMSEADFTTFLQSLFTQLTQQSVEGAIHYLCMDWRHLYELLTAARSVYPTIKNLCVWTKDNGGMGTFYRSQHELVLVAKHGTAPHINNFELGQHGRYRTNVWSYPGSNSFHADREQLLALHPTVKPVAMIADAIKDCSHRGGIILDSCAGSGSTMLGAEQTGRCAYLMKLDPRYVDTAVRRWERATGQTAHHAETGLTFTQMQEDRGHERA